jgi:opacity protein-like surface antigen
MNKSVVFIIGMLASGIVQANGWTGNINGSTGSKSLDSDWGEFDSQGEFGIISDFGHQSWPFLIAIDVFVSANDDNKEIQSNSDLHVDAVTSEIMIGIRRYYDLNYAISPYVGGGLSIGYAHREIKQSDGRYKDENDRGYGPWIGGGVVWRPWKHFNVGFDVRYSDFEVELFGKDQNAGGLHTGFNAGFHW